MVLTAPIVLALSEISSTRGMISSLSGIVTEAPPKSGERIRSRTSFATSVSKREYSCGKPVWWKRALCKAGDRDNDIGLPNR
ncbi:hypothetical protein RRF57_010744 [Xylaria bambusicola]|uniref:Uncharacterized protein n=1 Tax=Xylaria bambusicola TaxID=326684 RepID=A0AAN7Z9P6_9PEZI